MRTWQSLTDQEIFSLQCLQQSTIETYPEPFECISYRSAPIFWDRNGKLDWLLTSVWIFISSPYWHQISPRFLSSSCLGLFRWGWSGTNLRLCRVLQLLLYLYSFQRGAWVNEKFYFCYHPYATSCLLGTIIIIIIIIIINKPILVFFTS
jgi:hypothetical protein